MSDVFDRSPGQQSNCYNSTANIEIEELCLSYPFDLEHFDEHGFCPRADLTPIRLTIPLDWSIDPFKDRNWCFQLHSWRMNAPLLKRFAANPSPDLLSRSIGLALDWRSFHQKKKTPFSWMDMAAGLRAMQIAYFLDRIAKEGYQARKEERQHLLDLAQVHYEKLADENFLSLNNHGVFQAYGLKLLALTLGKNTELADEYLSMTFQTQYTREGLHKENSPSYHFFMTRRLQTFAAHKRLPDSVQEIIERAKAVQPVLVAPNGQLVRFGDTEGRAPKTLGRSDKLNVTDLSRSGFVAVRQKDSALFITGMAHSYTHKHADELSFELYHDKQPVFIDGGKYAYKSDKWRRYVLSTDAHNTVSIRNCHINPKCVELTGSLLQAPSVEAGAITVRGEVRRKKHFTQKRKFTYRPERRLTIRDRLSSETRRAFVSTLLLAPGLEPQLLEQGFEVQLRKCRLIATTNGRIEAFFGSKEPLLGWYSPSYDEIRPTWVVRSVIGGSEATLWWDIKWRY